MIAEHFDLGDLRDGKWFRLQPLVFRIRGINDDIAVEQPHSSRPGNERSCWISRWHRAGSGMVLIPPRAAMRPPPPCSPGRVSKWRSPSLFLAAFPQVQGDEDCRPGAVQVWRLSCSLFHLIAEIEPNGKDKTRRRAVSQSIRLPIFSFVGSITAGKNAFAPAAEVGL